MPNNTTRTDDRPIDQAVNILLVDDQPANLLALRAILDDLGHNLVEARSGEEALQQLAENDFAVVLLDVQMHGLDGFETARLIRSREKSRHTPIIFLTAYDTDRLVVEQAYALGAVDFLVKPLVPVILKAKVAGFVELFQKTEQVKSQAEELRRVERREFDQRPAEENVRLREQREWLRVTLGSIGDAVIATDPAGRVVFLNPVAESLTGWRQKEAEGQPLESVFPILSEETRQGVEHPVAKVLREGSVVDLGNHTVLVAKDGTEKPIDDSAAPITDEAGTVLGVVLIFRDVTEQRRSQRVVRESEARKAAILKSALDCIITMDHEGKVVEFNPAAERTFGYSRDEAVGQLLAELIVPPSLRERHRRGLAHYLATGEGPVLNQRIDMTALRADGTEFPVELAITRISPDGPPLFTAYLRDITERKRTERRRSARLTVTQILAQSATAHEAASGILRTICDGLEWDVSIMWGVDRNANTLRCEEVWHRPETPLVEFEALCRCSTFPPGVGLPGRVWASGKPAWIADVQRDENFPRAPVATKERLHGAFGIPILLSEEVLGVVEFVSQQLREPDPDLLEMMATLGGQFGQFLERRRAEDALRASEDRLAHELEAMTRLHALSARLLVAVDLGTALDDVLENAILTSRADFGNFQLYNPQTEGLEIVAQRGFRQDFLDHFRTVRVDEGSACAQAMQSGERIIIEDVNLDPAYEPHRQVAAAAGYRAVQSTPLKSRSGNILGMLSTHFRQPHRPSERDQRLLDLYARHAADLIERIRFEEALRRNEAQFRQLADAMPQIVWTARPDGFIDYYNERWYEFTGFSRGEYGQQSWEPILHPDDVRRCVDTYFGCIKAERPYQIEYRFKDRSTDGYCWFLGRAMPVRDEQGKVIRWFGTCTDIDDTKRAEEALREADRRKDEFLAMLAHELRNPLAPIRNGLQILKSPAADHQTFDKARTMMERQVGHMTRIVDDLLDVSRITRGRSSCVRSGSTWADLSGLLPKMSALLSTRRV